MVGTYTPEPYLAASGFAGAVWVARWNAAYGAAVLVPPEKNAAAAWSPERCRQYAGLRQICESVHDHLLSTFGLGAERPHTLAGFSARVAAKVALHTILLKAIC